MGKPILRFFSGLWEASVASSRVSRNDSWARRKRDLGEGEIWEMEHRGRAA
jgi:hypothetical protein